MENERYKREIFGVNYMVSSATIFGIILICIWFGYVMYLFITHKISSGWRWLDKEELL